MDTHAAEFGTIRDNTVNTMNNTIHVYIIHKRTIALPPSAGIFGGLPVSDPKSVRKASASKTRLQASAPSAALAGKDLCMEA